MQHGLVRQMGLPRGIPAASLKHRTSFVYLPFRRSRLPRGIPAASLKRGIAEYQDQVSRGLPRGIPAASLKRDYPEMVSLYTQASSAGNTRGLIEANEVDAWETLTAVGLPRGIPAASLKRLALGNIRQMLEGLPRGIPAASLKHSNGRQRKQG